MRPGRWFPVPVRLHPVTIPMMLTAMWLGEGKRLAIMSGSILLHEMAHILVACMLKVQVIELELMPVGGAARMENLWRLRPGQMAAVALAGPACNLLLMIISAALCWWKIMNPWIAAALIEQNVMILCFNLLPALPLDGGRILCGVLEGRMSISGAARVCSWLSRGLAVGILLLSGYGLVCGHLNLTLPAAAVFLLTGAQREVRQATASEVACWAGRRHDLGREKVLPVRWLAVSGQTRAYEAALQMKPGYLHRFAVYDEKMHLLNVVEEGMVLKGMTEDNRLRMDRIGEIDE